MPKQNIIATNFTSGEVSPLVRGRVDAQKYANGLETCENFIVRPQGPIIRRAGTRYLGKTKYPTQKSIIVPFEYSDTKGYVLEVGLGYIHIWQNDGKLFESTNLKCSGFTIESGTDSFASINKTNANVSTLVAFGKLGYGTIVLTAIKTTIAGTRDKIRVTTTTTEHGLRTNDQIWLIVETPGGSSIARQGQYTITRINDYAFDLNNSSTFAEWIIDPLNSWDDPSFLAMPIQAGDRVFFKNDAPAQTLLGNKYAIIHSIEGISQFTTNTKYISSDTVNQEIHIRPIEISTDYGYMPQKVITNITQTGNEILITSANHGYATGDSIEILKTQNAADGTWTIEKINDSTFKLVNSIYSTGGGTTGACRKYVGTSQLNDLRFVQSADVIYITHPNHPATKLTRLSNDGDKEDWLFAKVDFKDGPYLQINSLAPIWDEATPKNGTIFKNVYMQISNYSHTATISSDVGWSTTAAPNGDKDGYMEYRDGDQWRLALPTSVLVAGEKTATVKIFDNVLLHLDETTKLTARIKESIVKRNIYNPGSQQSTASLPGAGKNKKIDPNDAILYNSSFSTGNISSNFANTFGGADVGKYIRYRLDSSTPTVKWAQITRIGNVNNRAFINTAVVLAKRNEDGNFVITNEQRTATLKSFRDKTAFSAFKPTDINRLFRIGWGGRWVWGKITAYTSASEVSVLLYEDVPRDPHDAEKLAGSTNGLEGTPTTTGRSYDWRLGAWSDTTGYPSCGTFHEQRLWLGKTITEPQNIWGSVSGDFENFSPTELDSTVLEDNAIGFSIASNKVNPIKWMLSGPAITVGTVGGEWQIKSSSISSDPITPLNIVVVPHTSHGSNATVQPIRIGSSVVFADRPANKIRELLYDFSADSLVSKDMTYLSEHLLREHGGAVYSAYQQEPNNICWYVLNNGTLAGVTINKDQEIVAWHHHTISNDASFAANTQALVESIAVVPSSDASKDKLYMVVNRGGNRYVEVLEDDFYPQSTSSKAGLRFLDGIMVHDSKFTGTKVTGLQHLDGKDVVVCINGTQLGSSYYTVSNGLITIANQTAECELVVGIPYKSTAKSLPPEGGSAFGTSQGKIKKITKYNVRLLNSLALDYGFNANGQSLNSITNLHEDGSIANTNFYTGTKELVPNNPYDAESQWTLSTSKPYPLNILSVTMTVEAGE